MEVILDPKKLDEVIKGTLSTIESSKNEIFDISETARSEVKRAEEELRRIRQETIEIMEYLEFLEGELDKAKRKLVHVNKNFDKYTEQDLKEAYEIADKQLVEVAVYREKEKNMIQRRNDMEIRHKDALKMVEKANRLISQVSTVFDYLAGNLKNISDNIENIHEKQAMGIRVIRAQEEERQRVAREIHDGPAQLMSNVVLKAEICEKLIDIDISKTKFELNDLKKVVRDSLQDVRRIIYDLRPMSLDDLGLVPTIQRYVANFSESTGIKTDVVTSGNLEDLKPIVSLTAFRIVQESLSNIKKHSKASNAKIVIQEKEEKVIINVSDKGVGFDLKLDKKEHGTEGGFGLYGMRERIELLNGSIEIKSEIGSGTTIFVVIPNIEEAV